MLIGIDASRALRPRRTGTENYSLEIIRSLLKCGTDVRFRLYGNEWPAVDPFPATGNYDARRLPSRYLWTHLRLATEVTRHPPDVLFVPAHVLPIVARCPAVVTVHDLGYLYYPRAHPLLARLYLSLGTRFSALKAREVIAVSQATKRDLVRHYGLRPEKITVVYEGCSAVFSPDLDQRKCQEVARRHGLRQPYFLAIGSVHPRKNLVRLVRAFALARQKEKLPHMLAIVGHPGHRSGEVWRAVSQAGLDDAVRLTGYAPADDLPYLLRGAEAFVFPSLYEGFGLPALEAMATGVPVVAANASSLPEVVGDAGLLFDPLQVEDIANAITAVLTDGALRDTLRQRGLARARQFSWEEAAAETLRVLRRTASP